MITRWFFSTLLATTFLQAESLLSLLHQLGEEEELYHKTKVESAGSLVLYSREMINAMQARTLRDLLKSLRFVTYKEGYIAEGALAPAAEKSVLSSAFRLYIDGHELSSAIYGSSMLEFLDLDLNFVDHVEVYQGGNAIAFGNEPGYVTIRLYSKEPAKENANTLSIDGDHRGSKSARFLWSNINKKGEMIGSIATKQIRRHAIRRATSLYKKDGSITQLYGHYKTQKHHFSIGYFRKRKDAFIGVGRHQTPISPNEVIRKHFFANYLYRPSHHIEAKLSIDKIDHQMRFSDRNRIIIAQYPSLSFVHFDGKFNEYIFKEELSQTHLYAHGKLHWGLQAIQKHYTIKTMRMDGINHPQIKGPDRLHIYSAYIEGSYAYAPSYRLIATLKVDHYHKNFHNDHTNYLLARLGHIALLSPTLSAKSFLAHSYLYPGFAYMSTFPNAYIENPAIGAEKQENFLQEIQYSHGPHRLTVGGEYLRQTDRIGTDAHRMFINQQGTFHQLRAYLNYTYRWNDFHSITAQYYTAHTFSNGFHKKSPSKGATLRLFNQIGRWQFFNELIYREGFSYPIPHRMPITIDEGIDYTATIQWQFSRALRLYIKGENILSKASRSPIYPLGGVESIPRSYLCGLEYSF